MKYLLPIVGALLLSGCAPQLDRIEIAVEENAEALQAMQAENENLRREIESLQALFRFDQDAGVENSAQSIARFNRMQQTLEQLIRRLDDNTEYQRRLSARVDLLATRSGVPTLGDYTPPPDDVADTATGGASASSLSEEGRAIFQTAQLDRQRGNLELARDGLTEFLEKYGRSELADDALYWLGDLDYGQAQYAEALGRFQELLELFPRTELAPAALLKAAYCCDELARHAEATGYLERITADYPGSGEAGLAQEMLNDR